MYKSLLGRYRPSCSSGGIVRRNLSIRRNILGFRRGRVKHMPATTGEGDTRTPTTSPRRREIAVERVPPQYGRFPQVELDNFPLPSSQGYGSSSECSGVSRGSTHNGRRCVTRDGDTPADDHTAMLSSPAPLPPSIMGTMNFLQEGGEQSMYMLGSRSSQYGSPLDMLRSRLVFFS